MCTGKFCQICLAHDGTSKDSLLPIIRSLTQMILPLCFLVYYLGITDFPRLKFTHMFWKRRKKATSSQTHKNRKMKCARLHGIHQHRAEAVSKNSASLLTYLFLQEAAKLFKQWGKIFLQCDQKASDMIMSTLLLLWREVNIVNVGARESELRLPLP